MKIFFVQFCVFLPPLLISSASVRSIPFLSFIEPIFAWNIPLVSLIFLKRSLVFPFLLFFSISLHWSLRKAFLPIIIIPSYFLLLTVLWNSAFKWVYLFFSPLFFASLLFTAVSKASSESHFALLHFFFLGILSIPVSCTMSLTSFDSKGWWAVAAWRWSCEQPRGDSPRPRSGAEATRRYPTSRVPARQQALSEGIGGQTDRNHNHRKLTNPITSPQPYLTQWNYEPCHVGSPKTDGSWWRVLTKCGLLEKRMANHFSILALRTPWTAWKGKKIGHWKMNSPDR